MRSKHRPSQNQPPTNMTTISKPNLNRRSYSSEQIFENFAVIKLTKLLLLSTPMHLRERARRTRIPACFLSNRLPKLMDTKKNCLMRKTNLLSTYLNIPNSMNTGNKQNTHTHTHTHTHTQTVWNTPKISTYAQSATKTQVPHHQLLQHFTPFRGSDEVQHNPEVKFKQTLTSH